MALDPTTTALGVIPARGGSKGVPRKNLRPLCGEPLLVHTVRAALAAERVARTVVSTDSDEIAEVARAAGAEVVRRPAELARDESPTEDALIHVVRTLAEQGEVVPAFVATLEPTSPLRTPALIDACVELAVRSGAGAVITVAETRALLGRLDGSRFRYLEPGAPRRRQLREPLYRESSTVYVTRTDALLASRSVLAEPLLAVVARPEEALDINTPLEFVIAEAAMRWRARATEERGDG
jgi:CMP-N-acetylneuraminic acid synthetase